MLQRAPSQLLGVETNTGIACMHQQVSCKLLLKRSGAERSDTQFTTLYPESARTCVLHSTHLTGQDVDRRKGPSQSSQPTISFPTVITETLNPEKCVVLALKAMLACPSAEDLHTNIASDSPHDARVRYPP
jgi:hypothetical protein